MQNLTCEKTKKRKRVPKEPKDKQVKDFYFFWCIGICASFKFMVFLRFGVGSVKVMFSFDVCS